jgi:hypothetical protein
VTANRQRPRRPDRDRLALGRLRLDRDLAVPDHRRADDAARGTCSTPGRAAGVARRRGHAEVQPDVERDGLARVDAETPRIPQGARDERGAVLGEPVPVLDLLDPILAAAVRPLSPSRPTTRNPARTAATSTRSGTTGTTRKRGER